MTEIDPLHRSFTCSRLENKPQVVLELKAKDLVRCQENNNSMKAILRFVLVIDVSGSMYQPYGEDEKVSKLDKMKVFAESLTKHLRPDDELGIVCFCDKAEVIHKLSSLTDDAKVEVVQKIQRLDSYGPTNLGDGLFLAIELFKNHRDGVLYHDKIILFTDGDANRGIMKSEELLPAIQQRVRDVAESCGYGDDYRISISAFSTGGFMPELIVKIGEKFSNEAFYYLNVNAMLEQELFKSVVLHEATAIKGVKVVVRTLNGVYLDMKETSKEFLQASDGADSDDSEKEERKEKCDWYMAEYFINAVPFGMPKHLLFGLVLPVDHECHLREKDVLKFDLRYLGINGKMYKHTDIIPHSKIPCDILATKEKSLVKNGQQIVRKKASRTLGRAANQLKKRGKFDTVREIQCGIVEIQQACAVFKDCLTGDDNIEKMEKYTNEIVACLNGCLEIVEHPDEEIADIWATLKAEESCLAREAPVSKIFKKSHMQPFQLPKELQEKLGKQVGKICEIYKQRGLESTSAIKSMSDSIYDKINTGEFEHWQKYMSPILKFLQQCEEAAVQQSSNKDEHDNSVNVDLPQEIKDSCKTLLGLVFTISTTGHQGQLNRIRYILKEVKSDIESLELSNKLSKRRAKSATCNSVDERYHVTTCLRRRAQSDSSAVGKLSKETLETSENLLHSVFLKRLSSREQQENCATVAESNSNCLTHNNDDVF